MFRLSLVGDVLDRQEWGRRKRSHTAYVRPLEERQGSATPGHDGRGLDAPSARCIAVRKGTGSMEPGAISTYGLDVKRHVPSADGNKGPILEVLERVLPERGLVLEIGSGSGQHIVHFARALPRIEWQPSDYDQVSVASVGAYRSEARLSNVRDPWLLEVRSRAWGHGVVDGVLCIDLLHVTTWSCAEGLFDGARKHLCSGAPLVLHGQFRQSGGFRSSRAAEYDAMLRERNPDWGLRDLEAVAALGTARGLLVEQVIDMPRDSLCVVFRKNADN